MSTPDRFARVRICCTLETESPLHIGDGETTTRPKALYRKEGQQQVPIEIAAVAVDHEGRAYLPGRTIKGNLRSWLGHTTAQRSNEALVSGMFGREGKRKTGGSTATIDGFLGGKVRVFDAFARKNQTLSELATLPYWDSQRLTAVTASTTIQRTTRTVRPKMLFHEEFVPAGVRFDLTFVGDDLTSEEMELLLFAIQGFDDKLDHPARLGSGRMNGRGLMRVVEGSVHVEVVSEDSLAAWLARTSVGHDIVPWTEALVPLTDASAVVERARKRYEVEIPSALRLRVKLCLDAPFLSNDPSRTKKEGEHNPKLPDHAFLRDQHGQALLPADSLRGALRAQAERILRTLGLPACHADDPREACKPPRQDREEVRTTWGLPVPENNDMAWLCPACHLFGAAGWGSLLEVSDFVATEGTEALTQEFVAIDRFTGGASGGAKFNAEATTTQTLTGTLSLHLGDRAEPWMAGLLALVLRDLTEGDITIGFGAGKGYGACHAEIAPWSASTAGASAEPAEILSRLPSPKVDVPADIKVEALRDPAKALLAVLEAARAAKATPVTAAPSSSAQASATTGHPGGGEFHNPYHFVPVPQDKPRKHDVSVGDFQAGTVKHLTHDRYAPETFSGRIVCRLETLDPLVIGSQQNAGNEKVGNQKGGNQEPKTITPFELDHRPAIPGSSLRGLISSIAEAASNSAMRVLEDRHLSFRMAMNEAHGAIGMLLDGSDGKLQLLPLTVPPVRSWDPVARKGSIESRYRAICSKAGFPAYVNGYAKVLNEDHRAVSIRRTGFLEAKKPSSFSPDHEEYWWVQRPAGLTFDSRTGSVSATGGASLHVKTTRRQSREFHSLIGYELTADPIQGPARDATLEASHLRGILRVLYEPPRGGDMLERKHEIFIPFPVGAEGQQTHDVTRALATFHALADERTEADPELPYAVADSRRSATRDPKDTRLQLRAGDLVYFTPTNDGKGIDEISVASIWRHSAGSVYQYFEPEWLPFNPDRTKMSPAEQLFGFVSGGKGKAEDRGLALAGRVRFGFGTPHEQASKPYYLDEILLRILSTPKPPSPAFYFKRKNGQITVIKKVEMHSGQDLEPWTRLEPQGRKFYLHRQAHDEKPWESPAGADRAKDKLKVKVRPIKPGTSFFFHVDFDNLSRRELSLLCYSLRPTEAFRHKLGMGKPLGLGGVRIDPVGVFLVDRQQRYREAGLPRYTKVALDDSGLVQTLPGRYAREAAAAQETQQASGLGARELGKQFCGEMDPDIRQALELLGDPAMVCDPVRYPLLNSQSDTDEEHYQWFVTNEHRRVKPQRLEPLTQGTKRLPTLKRRHDDANGQGPQNRGSGAGGRSDTRRGSSGRPVPGRPPGRRRP